MTSATTPPENQATKKKVVSLKQFIGQKNAIQGFFQLNRIHLRRLGLSVPTFFMLYLGFANHPERYNHS